jgi:MFS family permease
LDRKWWTLAAVLIGVFMLLLDVTIVNVALPEIQRDLGSSFSDLQWVIDAYALTLASTLLVSGSVADLIGRRRVFVIGLVVFSLASLGCGLVSTPLHLNLFRGVQGVGGGMMFATSLALIAQAFQGRERGTAFGASARSPAPRWPWARCWAACSPTPSAGRPSSWSTSRWECSPWRSP